MFSDVKMKGYNGQAKNPTWVLIVVRGLHVPFVFAGPEPKVVNFCEALCTFFLCNFSFYKLYSNGGHQLLQNVKIINNGDLYINK